ncbi:MAG: OmpA family protein [Desulfovibrionaceae bacterium]|nr:OmpA family protein [Desulfovibrionaceae bacterium]
MKNKPNGDMKEYERLKQLLMHEELARVEALERRLSDPDGHAPLVGRDLPRAILETSHDGKKLTHALGPTVEGILHDSVRNDPKSMADALYPVMGPSIRRSIAEALSGMIQSFNDVLAHSLSWQGFKWRLEALRTKRSFAEVVLLHSLVYRVEQCFLIHRETGLVLQHLTADAVRHQDADMVAAMLTAIQDFVKDSFDADEGALDSLSMGELRLIIEKGPEAVLALVVRGNPPHDLTTAAHECLSAVHEGMRQELRGFNGDATVFEQARPMLKDCMRARYQEKKQKPIAFLAVATAAVLLAAGGGWYMESRHREKETAWNNYIAALEREPGILVAAEGRDGTQAFVRGLRDPLAREPAAVWQEAGIPGWDVEFRFRPYQSLEPEFVLRRAEGALAPPEGARLTLEDGVLHARGEAPMAWMRRARESARAVAGISGYDDTGLAALELRRFDELDHIIENRQVLFDEGSAQPENPEAIQAVAADIRRLARLSTSLGIDFSLLLTGTTSPTGNEEMNTSLRSIRTTVVRKALERAGVDPAVIRTGALAPPASTFAVRPGLPLRCVFFTVRSMPKTHPALVRDNDTGATP